MFTGPWTSPPAASEPLQPLPEPGFIDGPTYTSPWPEMSVEGCSTCGSGQSILLGESRLGGAGGCSTCDQWNCAPGHTPCPPCESDGWLGRFCYRLYKSVCCEDPCYEPRWLPIADAAWFAESARPVTQQRFRWDANLGMDLPDRSEYFWARADGKGQGPRPPQGVLGESGLRYHELSVYTEAATGAAGMFVEMPYRAVYPDRYAFAAGFGDTKLGMKSLLLDSEFLLCALQFRTYLPSGKAMRGLGTGHVSLEPSLLVAMKFSRDTCLQGQVSEWIPIGGDTNYDGSVLLYHLSLNRTIGHVLRIDPIVGTLEFDGRSFQTGQYTDPNTGRALASSGGTYASVGCGIRAYFCDRVDFGVGAAFGLTHYDAADQLYRTELRWRF